MITYAEALKIIDGLKLAFAAERLDLTRCNGRLLAEDLVARVPSPPFTNAAMDGFAVRREEALRGELTVEGSMYARALRSDEIPDARAGSCIRIMTGALLPAWADTVIPVEQAELLDDGRRVRFTAVPDQGASIRRQGEDFAQGALVLKKGARLDPERIMIAAAFGYRELDVLEQPHLQFFATGDELAEPGEPLPPGAIYNSSKYFLLAAAQNLGYTGYQQPPQATLTDDVGAAEKSLGEAADTRSPTILVTTGAVSAGEADFIPRLATRLGFTTLFHKVAIRPGKPVFLARKEQVIWLGLPGNQVSTCVGWHFFARPLLSAVAGLPKAKKATLILQNEVEKPEHLRCFYRAEVSGKKAWVAKRQGSSHLAASTTLESYVELPEGVSRFPAETPVEALIV